MAELLFGDYSPSGRLPVTFYRTVEELPPFEDYSMQNRTYRYMKNQALYPFGYGLSYTRFVYTQARREKETVSPGEEFRFCVTVRNAGEYDGLEAVQVYISKPDVGIRVPRWELCQFRKVFIRAKEETELLFAIPPESMALLGRKAPGFFRQAGSGFTSEAASRTSAAGG